MASSHAEVNATAEMGVVGKMRDMVRCSTCSVLLPEVELEGHICAEHLDYFQFSCGQCGHYFATEAFAYFHVNKKKHLPMKVSLSSDLLKLSRNGNAVQVMFRSGKLRT